MGRPPGTDGFGAEALGARGDAGLPSGGGAPGVPAALGGALVAVTIAGRPWAAGAGLVVCSCLRSAGGNGMPPDFCSIGCCFSKLGGGGGGGALATTCLGTTSLDGAATGARPANTACLVGATFGAAAKLTLAVACAGTATAACAIGLPEVRAAVGTAVTAPRTATFS